MKDTLSASPRYSFTPHVTLLYDPHLLDEAPLDPPLTWTVRDFTLVHSFHGQGRHRHIARFPLTSHRGCG